MGDAAEDLDDPLFERLASGWAAGWTATLGATVHVRFTDLNTACRALLCERFPEPAIAFPLAGGARLECASGLFYCMLSRLLGGGPEMRPAPPRRPTALEMKLARRVLHPVITALNDHWPRRPAWQLLGDYEVPEDGFDDSAANAAVCFEVTVGASRAWLRLSGPFADLHSQAVATLGHTRLTRQEIAGLSEGDVIVCDDQGIALQVAGVRHAAQIARIGTRRAIRICE